MFLIIFPFQPYLEPRERIRELQQHQAEDEDVDFFTVNPGESRLLCD